MMTKEYVKKQLKVELNNEGAAPCKHCLKSKKKFVYPKIVNVDELYYAQCPDCKYYDIYEFLGLSYKNTDNNKIIIIKNATENKVTVYDKQGKIGEITGNLITRTFKQNELFILD